MESLELKIPPPIVALLIGAAMWAVSLATSSIEVSPLIRVIAAIAIALAGVGIIISGAITLRRARTTVSAVKPETASFLVTSGVFRFTRNPIYVGLALVLLAWAMFMSTVLSFVGPLVFILYISRFQIVPEEKALSATFGAAYSSYQAKVRRWL